MSDFDRPPAFERARSGDWEAYEEIVASAIAPTFDAAWLVLGDADAAAKVTEDALVELLVAVSDGSFRGGDPLRLTGQAVVRAARAAKSEPFAAGLDPEDMAQLTCAPEDGRREAIAKTPAAARIAAILVASLDLEPSDLAYALGVPLDDALSAVDQVLASLPHDRPREGWRDILDSRAARVRVPFILEERALDRFEKLSG